MKIYKALIIEDEIPAQANLKRAIKKIFIDVEVVGVESSVAGAVNWLKEHENQADIIFMDVELSDGMCFEIFKRVDVKGKVIITTAYDSYAIKAFKVNSIDYILKPINTEELIEAVEKCKKTIALTEKSNSINNFSADGLAVIKSILSNNEENYKKRFTIRIGDHLSVINISDIAYFYSKDKFSYVVTKDGKKNIVDVSLNNLETELNPQNFFRISRGFIIAMNSIRDIIHMASRLKLKLEPKTEKDVYVSRSRTNDFLTWLEN